MTARWVVNGDIHSQVDNKWLAMEHPGYFNSGIAFPKALKIVFDYKNGTMQKR